MFTNQLHNQCLSRGIYPNGVRQLFSKCDGRWSPNQFGTLGHCRTGRLRQTEALKLSTNCKIFFVLLGTKLEKKVELRYILGQKIKKVQAKKLVKSNNSISRKIFFGKIPFFAISKMTKNQFLNWKKV